MRVQESLGCGVGGGRLALAPSPHPPTSNPRECHAVHERFTQLMASFIAGSSLMAGSFRSGGGACWVVIHPLFWQWLWWRCHSWGVWWRWWGRGDEGSGDDEGVWWRRGGSGDDEGGLANMFILNSPTFNIMLWSWLFSCNVKSSHWHILKPYWWLINIIN